MKTCTKCRVEKDEVAFSRDASRHDGLCCQCKACVAAYCIEHKIEIARRKAIYAVEHKVEIARRKAVYDVAHKEEKAEYDMLYRAEHRKKIAQRNAAYHAANREAIAARSAAYRAANKGAIAAQKAAWQKAHPEKGNAKSLAWAKNNPDKANARTARRAAAKLRATPAWANQVAIVEFYAAASLTGLEVDHVVPLKSPHVCGLHTEYNLQLLTPKANKEKGNRIWPDMW